MTDLTITPDIVKKRLKLVGRVASGEKVAVTILGFGSASTEGLRLRVMAGRAAVGVFPLEDGDEWCVDGANLTCTLNLSTEQADKFCRFGAETCVILEDTTTPQLYGVADLQLCPWIKLADVDVPVNLDNYKVKIGNLEDEIAQISDSVGKFGNEIAKANEILDPIRDLKGIEVKTNTTNGMRQAIKAIAHALGVLSVKTLVLCTLCAGGAEVTTAALGDLDLDTDPHVVTNVSFAGLASDDSVSALASDVESRALQSHYVATSNDVATLGTSVSAVWEQVFGESVWIAVTNYMRATDAKPSMGLWEKRDGRTNLVWSSAEEVDAKVDALRADVTNGIQSAQTAADSAKAWGRWQSADGSAAPDGFTAVSTPYLMLTGGGHWEQRTVGGGGSYWLFCGNGSLGGADEAFKMMDSSGESVFEVTQGGVREVAAIPSSFTAERKYDAVLGSDYMDVSFGVYATSQPKIYSAKSLDGPWREEEFASWSCSDGTNYVASMLLYPDPTRFFRAVYETGAESVVDFRRPLKFPKLSLGGTNYAVSVGVMSDGTKFLKLEGE